MVLRLRYHTQRQSKLMLNFQKTIQSNLEGTKYVNVGHYRHGTRDEQEQMWQWLRNLGKAYIVGKNGIS